MVYEIKEMEEKKVFRFNAFLGQMLTPILSLVKSQALLETMFQCISH